MHHTRVPLATEEASETSAHPAYTAGEHPSMRPTPASARGDAAAFPSLTEALARGPSFFAAGGQQDAGKARDFRAAFDAAHPATAPAPQPFAGFRAPVDHRARVVAELLARSRPAAAEPEAIAAAKGVAPGQTAAPNVLGLPSFDSETEESEYEEDVICEVVPESDAVDAAVPTVFAAEAKIGQASVRSPESDKSAAAGRVGHDGRALDGRPGGESQQSGGRPASENELPEAAAEIPIESEAPAVAAQTPEKNPRRMSRVSLAAVSSPRHSIGRASEGHSSPMRAGSSSAVDQGSRHNEELPVSGNVRESGGSMTGAPQARSILRRRPDDSPKIAAVFPEVDCADEGCAEDAGMYGRTGGMLVFPYDSPASRRASIASRVSILEDVTLAAINENHAGNSRPLVESLDKDALQKSLSSIANDDAVTSNEEETPAAPSLSNETEGDAFDLMDDAGLDEMDDAGVDEMDDGPGHDHMDANCDPAEGDESELIPRSHSVEKKVVQLQNVSASITPKSMLSKSQSRDRKSMQPRRSLQRARKPNHTKRLLRDLDVARAKREIELESANGPSQVRRSNRTRMEPLEFWRGEHKTYERRKSRIMPTLAEIEFIDLERKEAAMAAKAAKSKKASKAKRTTKLANIQNDENAENVPTSGDTANPSLAAKAKSAAKSKTIGQNGKSKVLRKRKRIGVNG